MSQTRYWIARLKPVFQPRIGLLMLSLGMVGVFGWTAWQYPELMSFAGINGSEERTAEDVENAENDAIGAEIDSLSVLNRTTRNLPVQPTLLPTAPPKPDAVKPQASILSTNFLGTNMFQIPGAGPTINFLDPAANTASNPLISSTNSINSPNSTGTTTDRTRTAQATQSFSLQPDPALQPSSFTPGSWNQFPQTPSQGSTGLPTTGLPMPTTPNQGSTGLTTNSIQPTPNAYTTLTNPSPYGLPIDSGVAPAVNPGIASPVNVPIAAPIVPQVLPGADLPVAPLQPEHVFTAPRPLPGRFIGGGNVNTFSNP